MRSFRGGGRSGRGAPPWKSAGHVPGDDAFFLEQINPADQATGRAAFDVPEGTEPVALKVEDVWSMDEPLEIRLG